jgi:hypothetical protein
MEVKERRRRGERKGGREEERERGREGKRGKKGKEREMGSKSHTPLPSAITVAVHVQGMNTQQDNPNTTHRPYLYSLPFSFSFRSFHPSFLLSLLIVVLVVQPTIT